MSLSSSGICLSNLQPRDTASAQQYFSRRPQLHVSMHTRHPLGQESGDGSRGSAPMESQTNGTPLGLVTILRPMSGRGCAQNQESQLLISTLEGLAVLMAIKLFYGDNPQEHQPRVLVVPTWTDNRGNGSALNKLMTTKFPASAVVMELAAHLKHRRLKSNVQWAPRTTNREADDLANGITAGFNRELRVHVAPSSHKWWSLPEASEMGRCSEEAFTAFKDSGRDPHRGKRLTRRPQEKRLRFVDPW